MYGTEHMTGRRWWSNVAALLGSFIGAAVTAPESAASMETSGAGASVASYLEERVPSLMERDGIPGATIALIEGGKVTWTQGFGYADREDARLMTTDTPGRPQSITKSITAWGVMTLVESGHVGLDDPVGDHITRWELPASELSWDAVTPRRLLSHTAGLPDGIYENYALGQQLPSLEETLSGRAGAPAARPVEQPSSFRYSNPGYVLLELLIEEVTGRDYGEYMQAEVLEPLAMKSANFALEDALSDGLATSYSLSGEAVPAYREPARAHGMLYATAQDIATFVAAGMAGPHGEEPGRDVLDAGSVAALYAFEAEPSGFHGFGSDAQGLGHFTETLPGGEQAVMHGGQGTGSWSWYHSVPEKGAGIVILTNSERSLRFIAHVVGEWAERSGLSSVALSRIYGRVETIVQVAAAVLAAISLGLVAHLARGIRSGAIQFAPLSRRSGLPRLLIASVGIAFLAFWWAAARPVAALLLLGLADWLSVTVSAFAALLLAMAMFPRKVQRLRGQS